MLMPTSGCGSGRPGAVTRTVVGALRWCWPWVESPISGSICALDKSKSADSGASSRGKGAAPLGFSNITSSGYVVAFWEKPPPEPKEDPDAKKKEDKPSEPPMHYFFREFESGTRAHYDFLFRNISDRDVEIGLKTSSCDGQRACVRGVGRSPEEPLTRANRSGLATSSPSVWNQPGTSCSPTRRRSQ